MYKKHLSILIASLMLSGCFATSGGTDPSSKNGQLISYQYEFERKKDLKTDAVFRKPASVNGKHPAVIILHDGGGWITERTRQYADLFIANGYATLEPRLFYDEKATRTLKKDLASLYSALEYLSKQPEIDKNKIYVVGMSAGANLAMLAKTKMAGETFSRSDTQFKAIAALYPVCWGFSDTIDGKPPSVFTGFSIANMQNWQSTPIRLFIPELDDYDDKDTKTCDNFIEKIPSNEASSTFSVKVYAGATHGWDHGKTYSFPTSYACKGKGCINTNQSNPTVTQQGYTDILEFFNSNQSQ